MTLDLVSSVQNDSPAEKAGLHGINENNSSNTQKVGDIITGIDGRHLISSLTSTCINQLGIMLA